MLDLTRSDSERRVAFSSIQSIESGVNELRTHQTEDLMVARKTHVMIPFHRDSNFVQRPAIWSWLEQRGADATGRMALVGMGGIGYVSGSVRYAPIHICINIHIFRLAH